MASLPSGYTLCNVLGGQNCYFDTGIVPSNDLKIVAFFGCSIPVGSYQVYYFGARNSNSNTSAGQINFLSSGGGQTAYLGYASARVSVSGFTGGQFYLTKNDNAFDLLDSTRVVELTGATTTFTGTRSMYLLAMNNAGSVLYGTGASSCKVCIQEFSISQNGTELHHYIPVYDEANQQFGLYDLVGEVFLTNQGTGSLYPCVSLEVQSSTGGAAWIMTDSVGYIKKKYITNEYTVGRAERLVAFPDPGYEFLNWTDQNGNVVSTESFVEYKESATKVLSADSVFTANFVKIAKEKQINKYQLLGLQYGVGEIISSSPNGNLSDIYATVLSFSCGNDMTTSYTSTIEVDSVPSLYQVGIPVFLFTPRGKMIWGGIIKEINGNVLTCREPISIFDFNMVFLQPTSSVASYLITHGVYEYVFNMLSMGKASTDVGSQTNTALAKMLNPFYLWWSTNVVFGDTLFRLPSISTGVGNTEEFLFKMSQDYGIIYEMKLLENTNPNYLSKGIKHLMQIMVSYGSKYGAIKLGTNNEAITNVEILDKNENANSLMVFNSAGTTSRGIFGVKTDGSIETIDYPLSSDFLAYSDCVNIVVASDDPLKSIIRENLGNAVMNHKITFDVDLTSNLFTFDDFKLGRRVQFYDGNKLYNSMITALSFAQDTNEDVRSVNVTLGNVRTKLTAKINIGKGK